MLAAKETLTYTPQPDDRVTYAQKVTADDARVQWTESALAIERKLRAFDPIPGAYAALNGERIKLWRAEVIPTSDRQQPGTIVSVGTQGIDVACGQGSLRVLELQPAGRRRMSAAAFVAGRPIAKGATFTDEIPDPRRP
jgi:methionyl-tRNA formyltransferase